VLSRIVSGPTQSLAEAVARLDYLSEDGKSDCAFSFRYLKTL